MSEIEPFATEDDAVARLEELARQRAGAAEAEQAALAEIKAVLVAAGEQPFDRSRLISASGLSRRTAYLVLSPKPPEE